jgi:V8-like Glu-specific endopeptidase
MDTTKRDHPNFDRKLLIVDRNGIEIKQTGAKGEEIVTQLKDFDSSGVISAYKYENESKTYYNYGSAVLLSPCHVITNRHVVTNKGTREVSAGHQMFFNVGQASCDSQNHFREQNRSARLVAMGSDEDTTVADWAILKLDQPSQVQFVPKMTDKATIRGERLVMVGYPGDTADRDRDEAGKSIGT